MDYFVLKMSRIFSISLKAGVKQQKKNLIDSYNSGVQLQLSNHY